MVAGTTAEMVGDEATDLAQTGFAAIGSQAMDIASLVTIASSHILDNKEETPRSPGQRTVAQAKGNARKLSRRLQLWF